MPRKKEESNVKKVYQLWWDYLKLSDDYKKFCKWINRKLNDPNLPIPTQGNWFELWDGYNYFGNVHVDSFEEWWEHNKSELGSRQYRRYPGPIEDYTEFALVHMEDIIEEFKWKNKIEPSLEEFKKEFFENLKFPGFRFYFMVTFHEGDQNEDLKNLFIKKLEEKKKQHLVSAEKRDEEYRRLLKKKLPFPSIEASTHKYITWARRWQYPTSPLRLDEVERYLQVYCLFAQGLKCSEIAEKIEPDYKGDSQTLRRTIYKDKDNALKIISNAERGIFPGQY